MKDLKNIFNDHVLSNTDYADNLIINGIARSEYGQYKQAVRELYKRFRGLRECSFSREKLDVDIAECKYLSENAENEFERQRNEIDYRHKISMIEESDRVLNDTKREFVTFYKLATQLKKIIGEISVEKRFECDRTDHLNKIKELVAMDFIASGRVSKENIERITHMPEESKKDILNSIKDPKTLVNWFENEKPIYIDYNSFYNKEDDLKLFNFEEVLKLDINIDTD